MATIGQIDPAGTAGIRGIGPGSTVTGLQNEDQDEFNRGADIERAEDRDSADARPAVGDDQSGAGAQVGGAANVNQANAVATNNNDADQQSEVRSEVASQDQQLPTPFDPSRGTQLDIAV
jgi:hypothetical protein